MSKRQQASTRWSLAQADEGGTVYVGWDWASESHDVSVMDEGGKVVDRFVVEHDEAGLVRALKRLRRHGDTAELPVAIETTNGIVVERLLDAGHPVVPIHPNAFNAARPRWGAARAKSDPGDSHKLADYLRTDGHRLRQLRPLDPETAELQALVRQRGELIEARVRAVNRLGSLLERHWPAPRHLFSALETQIALAFLESYPTPQAAAGLTRARLGRFLRGHGYAGRRTTAELLARLRAAPVVPAPLPAESVALMLRGQVSIVRALVAQVAELELALAALLERHARAPLFAHLPRTATVSRAKLLAEVGPILDRATDVAQAAAEAGASPVTKSSGKSRGVHFRWAANKRARTALSLFADNSRHASPWAAQLYAAARARGKDHPHAVRILMRAWLRVLWACWHSNIPYDPARHHAEQRLASSAAA
jgi:transposase